MCETRGSRADTQIVVRIFDFRPSTAVQFSGAVITNSAIRNSARRGNFAFNASTCSRIDRARSSFATARSALQIWFDFLRVLVTFVVRVTTKGEGARARVMVTNQADKLRDLAVLLRATFDHPWFFVLCDGGWWMLKAQRLLQRECSRDIITGCPMEVK